MSVTQFEKYCHEGELRESSPIKASGTCAKGSTRKFDDIFRTGFLGTPGKRRRVAKTF